MSNNKKKKNNQKNKAQNIQKKQPAPQKNQEMNEENIPVQSLSEMLAFAAEAEAAQELDDKDIPAQSESEPVKENSAVNEEAAPKAVEKEVQAEAKPSDKPAPKYTAPNGMPISEAEAARQADALDALDRDLAAAKRKKQKEEAYQQHQRELEQKKEEERIAKAEQAKLRHENAAAAAKKLDEAKKSEESAAAQPADSTAAKPAPSTPAKSGTNAAAKQFNRSLDSMTAIKAVVGVVIVAALAYGGSFIYVNSVNNKFYDELSESLAGQTMLADESSIPYTLPASSALKVDEKISFDLTMGRADTDMDGLSDEYEIKISETDPANPDTDGDGLLDGREIQAGLDPKKKSTDDVTPDGEAIKDINVGQNNVSADIKGISQTAYVTVSKFDNNSIQGTPGLVGNAYEFYSDKNYDECILTFHYSDNELNKWDANENYLSIFRFNADSLTFERIDSTVDTSTNSVSASIDTNGVYAVCDSSVMAQSSGVNIFFLIDNSGSMYPEELCHGSEENDVEFKRLDFATNLIDMLDSNVSYGAGEFSGGYSNIVPISDDIASVKKKISDIRNKNQVFSGTEIAGAITNAVKEFEGTSPYDKNYIILLTDGMPSNYNAQSEAAAVKLATDNNITIFTIGLGKYIDSDYLSNIAGNTNGQFFQASNADALENIYDKIQSFMSYNRITIEEETDKMGYIVADSGFNFLKDAIAYTNFRSDFAPNGADAGIAGLIRAYYTGELEMSAEGYVTDDGREIPGYDISQIEGFSDTRIDFNNVKISMLDDYNAYLSIADKWDFRNIPGSTLRLTDSARSFCEKNGLLVTFSHYNFRAPQDEGIMGFLRTITFNQLQDFKEYECAIISTDSCEGDDLAVMQLLNWYCNLPFASDKTTIYDFGYEGDAAFNALIDKLTTGDPAVIAYGGTAMNAVRIARDAENPDAFVIDAYDCNTPGRATRINLTRTPIYNDSKVPTYQYIASRGSAEDTLIIIT